MPGRSFFPFPCPLAGLNGFRLRCVATALSLLVVSLVSSGAALPPRATKACAYTDINVNKYGRQELINPPEVTTPIGAEALNYILNVSYTNPREIQIAGCPVTLRTYNGELVGPTLRVHSGQSLNILLNNRLPRETASEIQSQFDQEASHAFLSTQPASFNTTNLHTHGLHVSPAGNSDNVLLAIEPQSQLGYEIKVPSSHPPGTFWYHAHAHGSTAIQVGSGMAGSLIIDDDEATLPPALREANLREKVMVLQTILYNQKGRLNDITALFPSPTNPNDCSIPANQNTWGCSKRRITINGQIVPRITMRPGEVQRWRLIDTAFRESIALQLEGHDLHEIALDGLYLGRVDTWPKSSSIDLQPGYRSDVLVKASDTPGTYRLLDGAIPASSSLRGVDEPENLLAEVVVEGEPLNMSLPTSEEMKPLAPFPGVDLTKTADGVQQVDFKIGHALQTADQRNYFQVNYQAFNPQQHARVQLNAADLWAVDTSGDPSGVPNSIPPLPHVFHIHVNPFQTTRQGPHGEPELVWKDTLLIPAGKSVNLYTQYLDYIGSFVMHCHILDHEDLGMMEVVEVVNDGSAVAPHSHA